MPSKNTGIVRATATQNRRVMSDEFRILFFVERSSERFERHAADRATAWAIANDLRMHRAGVFLIAACGGGWRVMPMGCGAAVFLRKAFRILAKPIQAMRTAEIVSLTLVFERTCGPIRIDSHTANRIDYGGLNFGLMGCVIHLPGGIDHSLDSDILGRT